MGATVTEAITAASPYITVASVANFPATPFIVTIGAEQLLVTGTSGTSNTTWSVIRGYKRHDGGCRCCKQCYGFTRRKSSLFGLSKPLFNQGGTTTLTAAVTPSQTTFTVASDANFPTTTPFVANIGSEEVEVTAVSGTNNTTWTVVRGYANTLPNTYAAGTSISNVQNVQSLNYINTIAADYDYSIPNVAETTVDESGGMGATDTTLTVASSTDFPAAPFDVMIGTEQIQVTAVNGDQWTITRGYNGTPESAHSNGVTIELITSLAQPGGLIANSGATSLIVDTSAGFQAAGGYQVQAQLPFVIQIDSEKMEVTAINGTSWTVVRGYDNTTVAAHGEGAAITMVSTHPALYVGGDGGVFRSLDQGETWTVFPDTGYRWALLNRAVILGMWTSPRSLCRWATSMPPRASTTKLPDTTCWWQRLTVTALTRSASTTRR